MKYPSDRRYTEHHVWVKPHEDDQLTVGITEHAQHTLGNIEALELPPIGTRISGDDVCGSIESLKAVSDLVAPLDATVLEHNDTVHTDPGMINEQPYEDGWLLRLGGFEASRLETLLNHEGYRQLVDPE